MQYDRVTLPAQTYLYVDRECSYDGPAIADAMGSAFRELFGFLGQQGILPLSAPMAVYLGMDPKVLRFRGAVMVSAGDAAKAAGMVKSDTLPAGEAMTVTHVGPYTHLNQTHRALWSHMEAEGIPGAMPTWEIYVDDPDATPQETLRTEIYRRIG